MGGGFLPAKPGSWVLGDSLGSCLCPARHVTQARRAECVQAPPGFSLASVDPGGDRELVAGLRGEPWPRSSPAGAHGGATKGAGTPLPSAGGTLWHLTPSGRVGDPGHEEGQRAPRVRAAATEHEAPCRARSQGSEGRFPSLWDRPDRPVVWWPPAAVVTQPPKGHACGASPGQGGREAARGRRARVRREAVGSPRQPEEGAHGAPSGEPTAGAAERAAGGGAGAESVRQVRLGEQRSLCVHPGLSRGARDFSSTGSSRVCPTPLNLNSTPRKPHR